MSVQLDTDMLHRTFEVSVGGARDHVLFTARQSVTLVQTRFDVDVGAANW